ncbi:hypothetical protein RB653_001213 [Dictyostelium firmibasis]|uniref:RING-type E3 ubiquitin transferase n=1 Tax=Dictyostelium firmibasis TaxID=79012 RepID=A0AAN7U3U5_9MYCE
MGRSKSHNKLYITKTEWTHDFGGKKEGEKKNAFRPLPFYCCSLSLQHLDDPMSNENGNLFDLVYLMPFIKKYGKDPITNKTATMKDYFPITFSKNENDEYHCPILNKVFTDFTHIVCIKTTGNVYSYDAVNKLNIEAKNWTDLLSDKPFTKNDIITIQDPVNRANKNNISSFHFVKEGLDFSKSYDSTTTTSNNNNNNNNEDNGNVNSNEATSRIFKELKEKGIPLSEKEQERALKEKLEKQQKEEEEQEKKLMTEDEKKKILFEKFKKDKQEKEEAIKKHAVQAPSFTSTGFTKKEFTEEHPSLTPGKKTKKKGYLQLKTNLGDLNIQLHCDLAPKACENFLSLSESGYYNGVTFHRLIKNFMIQGGDPTGTGSGGQSVWKKPFKDEFSPLLKYNERGLLCMANSGTNTNGSQFFITLKADLSHLERKHTIFGKVVGGLEVLKTMEMVKTDESDRPNHTIKINAINIFENPFNSLDEEQFEEKLKQEKKESQKKHFTQQLDKDIEGNQISSWYSNPTPQQKVLNPSKDVGKYLPTSTNASTSTSLGKRLNDLPPPKNNTLKENLIQEQLQKKSKTTGSFGNFSNW